MVGQKLSKGINFTWFNQTLSEGKNNSIMFRNENESDRGKEPIMLHVIQRVQISIWAFLHQNCPSGSSLLPLWLTWCSFLIMSICYYFLSNTASLLIQFLTGSLTVSIFGTTRLKWSRIQNGIDLISVNVFPWVSKKHARKYRRILSKMHIISAQMDGFHICSYNNPGFSNFIDWKALIWSIVSPRLFG